MNQDTKTNMTDFAQIKEGGKFYISRVAANASDRPYTKITSRKSEAGRWSNALDCFGNEVFVKYDARVWTV